MERKVAALGPFGQPDSLRVLPLTKDGSAWVVLDKQDWDWAKNYSWHTTAGGYARRGIGKGKWIFLHREIAKRKFGKTSVEGMMIDHIDRNPCNNRRANIRLATPSQNCQNRSHRKDNVSGVPGVFWVNARKRWYARIGKKYLGEFASFEQAVEARKNAEEAEFGVFAPKYTDAERLAQEHKLEVARAKVTIDEGIPVKLLNREGKEVVVRKRPRLRDMKQQERLEEAAAELERNQVSLTYKNLMAMGFGMTAVREFVKKRKREVL